MAANQLVDNEPTPEFVERCDAIIRMWERGNLPFKEAVAHLSICRQEANANRHLANEGHAERRLGILQFYQGNIDTSLQHWERARESYVQVGNRKRVAALDMNLGESYRLKGNFGRALDLYHTAYAVLDAVGDRRMQSMAAFNAGLALVAVGQYDVALVRFEDGLTFINHWDANDPMLPKVLCEAYNGMATVYLHRGDLEAAWHWAVEAMDMAERYPNPIERGRANNAMGKVMTQLDHSPDPRFVFDPDYYFRASADAFREVNAEPELAQTTFDHALSLLTRGQEVMAKRKLQQVAVTFAHLGMAGDAARVAEAQARLAS